jgi:hypothetical protein
MQGTAAVTLSNENGLSRSRPSAHTCSPRRRRRMGPSTGASRAVLLTPPCPPTNQRYSACAPTSSISLAAATTAHLSERSSPTWHALKTA